MNLVEWAHIVKDNAKNNLCILGDFFVLLNKLKTNMNISVINFRLIEFYFGRIISTLAYV